MHPAVIPHSVNNTASASPIWTHLLEQIKTIEHYPIEKTKVHIIDREGDSIAHLRELSSHGFQWLIRAKESQSD